MEFKDLIRLYEEKKKQHGEAAFRHISELLSEAKILHKKGWSKSPTPNKDHEQSWRAFKGKNLEKLILYMIEGGVHTLGLKVVDGNTLERSSQKLSEELSQVKRNLLVDYGEFGEHLPDVDIIIYDPSDCGVIAVVSSKVTLRERIAQTGYWKIKLSQDEVTRHVKVFFVTPDEDKTLNIRTPAKKGRAIVEIDTDGSYVMTEEDIEESDRVKSFDKFFIDLKNLIDAKRKGKRKKQE